MVSAKDEMIMIYMDAVMERFNGDDLRFLKEKFWMISYNFSISEIKTTELATTNGCATEQLFAYFKIGKISSGKSESTVEQYKRVVYHLNLFRYVKTNGK